MSESPSRFLLQRLLAWPLVVLLTSLLIFLPTAVRERQGPSGRTPREMTYGRVEVCGECFVARYSHFWQQMMSGDMPRSPRSKLTTPDAIGRGAPVTLTLIGLILAVAAPLGTLLGILLYRRQRAGRGARWLLATMLALATPSFLLIGLLITPAVEINRQFHIQVIRLVGGFSLDRGIVIPVVVLALRPTAYIARLTSIALEEVLRQDFIRTARSKGLPEWRVWLRHAVPHLLAPWATAVWGATRFTFAAVLVVEVMMAWIGLGYLALDNLGAFGLARQTDLDQLAAIVTFLAVLFLALDTGIAFLLQRADPQARAA